MGTKILRTLRGPLESFLTPLLKGSLSQQFCHFEANRNYDIIVVGGGIVGTAVAREIMIRHSTLRVALLEKENKLALHQSSHNGGVIHSGIYYTPGSATAKLCVDGLHQLYDYCTQKNIPYKKCGKIIVATNEKEINHLMHWYQLGRDNKVPDLELIDSARISEIEPFCKGIKGLWSPHTGIVDYALLTNNFAQDFQSAGGDIHLDYDVAMFSESISKTTYPITILGSKESQMVKARFVITCAGLQSDYLAQLTGCSREPQIIPFRGEYFILNPQKCHMIKGNVYAVPDPRFLPSLGPHFTPQMNGSVLLGPSAVIALKREGYNWGDVDTSELIDTLGHPGFLKMVRKYFIFGLSEITKSAFVAQQLKALQKFVPDVTKDDIVRGPTGVRAQSVDENGNFITDLLLESGTDSGILSKILHCRNVPSPGATSSLAIAKLIADKVEREMLFPISKQSPVNVYI